jgi:hypothetical protein
MIIDLKSKMVLIEAYFFIFFIIIRLYFNITIISLVRTLSVTYYLALRNRCLYTMPFTVPCLCLLRIRQSTIAHT